MPPIKTAKIDKIASIILEDLPEMFPEEGYRAYDVESFKRHMINSPSPEWSERGADLRCVLQHRSGVSTAYIYFISRNGWGDLTQDRLDKINERFVKEVGDVRR